MAPDTWERIQALFQAATALAPEAQAAYLAEACPEDAEIRAEVLGLLAADRDSGGRPFLSQAVDDARASLSAEAGTARIGEQVGPYRLVRELGQGGMGTVYLAERVDGEYSTRVAIKFVRGILAAPELARRLRVERQVLADLTHPNIAWLLDGGHTEDGTPYLVMEYVDGVAVDQWCEEQGLDLSERLALFRQICLAVQHAHQALIVHRDLKPSNILVTADGTPKLLDFGIAKLITAPDAGETGTLRAMTPAYAAPEQVRGERISVATDVYALGGLLYRLLADRTAIELSGVSMGEMERRITESEPPPPSSVATGAAVAWRRTLRGDLDTIILKALRKEPARRYASVEQLTDDLDRYASGRPVRARPATWRYRGGKFLQRNRAAVLAAGAVLLLTTGYTVQLGRERDRARLEAAKAGQVAAFLQNLFEVSDPSQSRTETITARELLDRGAARIAGELQQQPEVQATMMETISRVYHSLGYYQPALDQAAGALAIRRRSGKATEELADAETAYGAALEGLGQMDSAVAHHREALRIERVLHRGNHEHLVMALATLGANLKDGSAHLSEAETVFREALAMREALGPNGGSLAMLSDGLASSIGWQGRYAEAEPWFRQAVTLVRARVPVDSAVLSIALHNLALNLRSMGRIDEAIELERQALAVGVGFYGPNHPYSGSTRNGLAMALRDRGDLAEAEALFRVSLAADSARLGLKHQTVGSDYGLLGTTLLAQGKLDEAEYALRRALAIRRAALGSDHPYVAISINELAGLYLARGKLAEAESRYREALRLRRAQQPPHYPYIAYSLVGLARTLITEGRAAEAKPLLVEADSIRGATLPEGHRLRLEVDSLLGLTGEIAAATTR